MASFASDHGWHRPDSNISTSTTDVLASLARTTALDSLGYHAPSNSGGNCSPSCIRRPANQTDIMED